MGRLVLYMSMSLDGFIAGPGDNVDNPFGTKGHRLHEWLGEGREGVSGFFVQLVPVLFGEGRRPFGGLGPDHIELERVRTLESSSAPHLRCEMQYA